MWFITLPFYLSPFFRGKNYVGQVDAQTILIEAISEIIPATGLILSGFFLPDCFPPPCGPLLESRGAPRTQPPPCLVMGLCIFPGSIRYCSMQHQPIHDSFVSPGLMRFHQLNYNFFHEISGIILMKLLGINFEGYSKRVPCNLDQ